MSTPSTPSAHAAPTDATDRPHPPDLTGRRVHFIGIGGAGMSGLARLVAQQGGICTGADRKPAEAAAALRDAAITVTEDADPAALPAETELVVASAAVKPDHPQLVEARRRGLTVLKYAAMLGRLMEGRCGVAIAGTHGKSTTTSMLCHILIQTGLDPSFIVGAQCHQIGGGSRCGGTGERANDRTDSDGILVAEACEYDRSFHNLRPRHAVILNVEADHLDIYDSLDQIVTAFAEFARLLPSRQAGGSLLINHAAAQRMAITAGLGCDVQTLGFSPEADWQIEVSEPQPVAGESDDASAGIPSLHLYRRGELVAAWPSPLPGEHMACNAAAAAITANRLGADWNAIAHAIASFRGLDRRMQRVAAKTLNDTLSPSPDDTRPPRSRVGETARNEPVTVIDDYGHHPTEIETTLRALRGHYRPGRLVCVFQPHQHSRTRFLMEQFAASFSQADIVIVPDIYFVRDSEQERQAVTAGDLVDALRARNVRAMHMHPFEAIVEQLEVLARPGDLLVTMGAGDVWKVARDFLNT